MDLRPLTCWDCGFESRRWQRCLSRVSIVFVRYRSLCRDDNVSRGVLPSGGCLNFNRKPQEWGDVGPWGLSMHAVNSIHLPVLGSHLQLYGTLIKLTNGRSRWAVRKRSAVSEIGEHWIQVKPVFTCRGADKSLARPRRNQATVTEDFDVHISYL
jgi:hypothetical protein